MESHLDMNQMLVFHTYCLPTSFPIKTKIGSMYNNFCALFLLSRSAAIAGQQNLFAGIQIRHAALERNKRCLLAYL